MTINRIYNILFKIFHTTLKTKDVNKRGSLKDLENILFTGEGKQDHRWELPTTCGRPAEEDVTMIDDVGLRVKQ